MSMSVNVEITGFCFAVVSIVVSFVTIFFQIWVVKLRKFPGVLVTMQCICQVVYDFHWLTALPAMAYWLEHEDPRVCKGWGIITMQFYFLGYNYATSLSIEIIYKLRNRSNVFYKKRLYMYHAVSWGIATFFSILLYSMNGYGVSGLHTCSVTNNKSIHSLEYVPFGLNLPIMWFSVIYSLKHIERKYTPIALNFTFIVLSVSITWFFPTFFKLIVVLTQKDGNWTFIAFIIGTLSGTFVGLSRIINRKVIKEIKKKIREGHQELNKLDFKKVRVEYEDKYLSLLDGTSSFFESSELDFFTNFHENLSKNVIATQNILNILLTLVLKYRTDANKWDYTSGKIPKKIRKFEKEEFDSLANFYGISKVSEGIFLNSLR